MLGLYHLACRRLTRVLLLAGRARADRRAAARSLHAVDGAGAAARRRRGHRRRAGQPGAVGAADARGVRQQQAAPTVASPPVLVKCSPYFSVRRW